MGTDLNIRMYDRRTGQGPDDGPSVDDDLAALRRLGHEGSALRREGRQDDAKLRGLLESWGTTGREAAVGLKIARVEGREYGGRLWEASYFRLAPRSDEVRGYSIFFIEARNPKTGGAVVLLLTLVEARDGKTPRAAITEAWKWAQDALTCIENGDLVEE